MPSMESLISFFVCFVFIAAPVDFMLMFLFLASISTIYKLFSGDL
jgi:hypothetical protein